MGNLISTPSHGDAVYVAGGSNYVIVQHNMIGVTAAGDQPSNLTNTGTTDGILVRGRLPGQSLPISHPQIKDNQVAGLGPPHPGSFPGGIVVGPGVSNGVVEGNSIGTDAAGKQMPVGGQPYVDAADGIDVISADANQPTAGTQLRGNVIGGMRDGIQLTVWGARSLRAL